MNNNKSSKIIDLKRFEELLSNKDNAVNIFNDRTYKFLNQCVSPKDHHGLRYGMKIQYRVI